VGERLLLEGEDLPVLMARVRDEFGPRATIVRAERVRRGGFAGFFQREHYELTIEVPDPPARPAPRPDAFVTASEGLQALLDAADRAEAGDDEPAPAVSTSGARFETVLQGVRALAGFPTQGSEPVAPPAETSRTSSSSPSSSSAAASAVPAVSAGGEPTVPAAARPPELTSARAPAWGQAAVALLNAGVPAQLLDQAGSVEQVLERIPDPPHPPRRPGQVLALVGPRDAAAATAALLRLQWQLPAEAVVEAGPDGLASSSAAVRWRMHTAEAGHSWLLVVPSGDDPTARHLATALVAAVQPDQVWAVVDARMKREDAARWLEQVGAARRPDGLAVQGLLDTSDPGTVLGLGVPVAWADGVPASRVLWAAVLGQGVDAALTRPRR
jgi:hypothetical protein